MNAPSADRLARLRDFQHGRAPELASLVDRAVRTRPVPPPRALLEDVIEVLAAAAGMPATPVCEHCKRTLGGYGCRACRYCGHWNPRPAPAPVPAPIPGAD